MRTASAPADRVPIEVAQQRALAHLPGEEGLPIGLGNVLGWTRNGVAHLVEKERRFGPVFRSQLGLVPFVHVGDPEIIAQINRNEEQAWSVVDFDLHRDVRRLLQPTFGSSATESYLGKAMPFFEQAIESWVEAGRVDFKDAIRGLLARIAAPMFLGVGDDVEAKLIEAATTDASGTALSLVRNPWVDPGQPRPTRRLAALVTSVRRHVAKRRARGGEDLLSRLCVETRGAEWLDDDVARLFVGIVRATFETAVCALTSMAYLLAKNPEWQDRLRTEAERIGWSPISYEKTRRLETTERAFRETLRLMPITRPVPRRPVRDVQLGAWRIPAGALVNSMVGTVLRSGSFWTNPDRFDPDRFSHDRAEDRDHKALFSPFGCGAHAGIGMHLATVAAKAFWHTMLTRCSFRLEPDYDARHTYAPLGIVSGDVKLVVDAV